MRNLMLAASALALAVAAPALADKGGHGGGGGNGGGGEMKAEHGGGGGGERAMRQIQVQSIRAEQRGNGEGRGRAMFTERSHAPERIEAPRQVERMRNEGRREAEREMRVDRPIRIADREVERAQNARRDENDQGEDNGNRVRVVTREFDQDFGRGRGLVNGCPPGLAKKDNGCLPPGQAMKLVGTRLQQSLASSQLPYQYRSWYRDDPTHLFRADNDYIYEVNRTNGMIDGIIPLFSGNTGQYYAVGDPWPDPYNFYNVPYQYRSYYPDGPQYDYRYGDGAIYRVNSGSGVIDAIVALLAGDLGVGSRLPMGYDAYNVPFAYRDRYYDTADNWYRYNDGYIYQVDPKTRLITAVINALI